MEKRTHDGGTYRMLNVVDPFAHACLAIRVGRRLKSADVIDVLSDLFILRGLPNHLRSDNGPEFVAKAVRERIHGVGASTSYVAPASPWKNGTIESFNARMRDELLDGEISSTLRKARTVIESWHRHLNGMRPHSLTGYQAPAPETTVLLPPAWPVYRWYKDQPFTNIATAPPRGGSSPLVLHPLDICGSEGFAILGTGDHFRNDVVWSGWGGEGVEYAFR